MPTTSYVNSTFSANVIGARTDATGGAVTDLSAEEARFATSLLAEGYLTTNAFKVAAQASPDMTVKIGSGVAKADYYCVAGEAAGQGNYVVRLDVTSQNVTIDAADAAQTRIDEIYLVVRDNVYDISSRALPQISYRKGDVGGSAPGVDTAWKASVKLATVTVAANATSISSGVIADARSIGGVADSVKTSIVTAKGDLLVATGSGVLVRKGIGTNGQVLTVDTGQSTDVTWATPVVASTSGIATQESTTSASFTDLATVGPSVTIAVGSSGIAIVTIAAVVESTVGGTAANTLVVFSGANSGSGNPLGFTLANPSQLGSSTTNVITGLTPGSTTFKMLYSSNGGSSSFRGRQIGVVTF